MKTLKKIENWINNKLGWFLNPAHKQGKEKQNAKWNKPKS